MEPYFIEHIKDLSARSDRQNCYTFSDFLTMEEQSALLSSKRELISFRLFGGIGGAERQMVRFGDPDALGYEEDFPIVCVKITPRNQKFADTLTHRDFLGTLMGQGIKRETLGDIVVRENAAYVFAQERIANYITENVDAVRHTAVTCRICDELPKGALFSTKNVQCISASQRLDCIVGAVFRESRSASQSLISSKKVFVNGAVCENASYQVKDSDVISVRGKGKFIFAGVNGQTKKGRLSFTADIYI